MSPPVRKEPENGLLQGIDEFASEFVGNKKYQPKFPKDSKIIHDPLWGTIKLYPWEIALLDLPLFQRLRQIHQTSLVSYVFPGCSHTRFEHTLGVIQQTQKLIDAVNSQYSPKNPPFEQRTIRNLRLAALFHDCGHSCFSHISEDLIASCPDMKAMIQKAQLPRCNPHEALSYLILKSEPVRRYLREIEKTYKDDVLEFDVEKAANWIAGITMGSEKKTTYETQVINGPFDADKLDYIFRDAHYSGIPVGLDLDRLWASCKASDTGTQDKVLTLHQASVAPLEQILFSKINLFAVVYQHPKVRAAEKMFQAVIESAQEDPTKYYFRASGKTLDLRRASDFLWMTDEVFFSEALRRKRDDPLHKRVHDIRYRRFLVRALTISNDTIDERSKSGFLQLRKLNQRGAVTYRAKRELAAEIVKAAGLSRTISSKDVWVDLPSDPQFGEADRTFVRTSSGNLRKVSEIFPIHYWTELYKAHKWRGHVFCLLEHQQRIHEAALEVFMKNFGLRFKLSAGEASHVPTPKQTFHAGDAKRPRAT